MCITKLAKKTITAARRIGSHSAITGTIDISPLRRPRAGCLGTLSCMQVASQAFPQLVGGGYRCRVDYPLPAPLEIERFVGDGGKSGKLRCRLNGLQAKSSFDETCRPWLTPYGVSGEARRPAAGCRA